MAMLIDAIPPLESASIANITPKAITAKALARPPCDCNNHSPRGCDSFCEHFTEGIHCESCKKGFYGNATAGTPYDCTPCPCPGGADCFVDKNGQVSCRNCPAGYAGRLCDTCAPGYAKSATTGGRECEPIGHVEAEKIQFVGDFPNRRRRLTYKINAYLSRRH
uniref:Laminin EGF-like domain-containing protein n=1 Tax=Acrobeloides nanus TaxID=290746 RepID=A0A914DIE1_9BILA